MPAAAGRQVVTRGSDVEYYLCEPPPMINACVVMLIDLGVEPENILFDKFG